MRSVPSDMASKLALTKQTRANAADPSASVWIGRPTTPLTADIFLEKQTVLTGATITDTSVAVCHPRRGAVNTKISIAYISSGLAKIVETYPKAKMSNHIWFNTDFSEPATAVSIAYDGRMPKNDDGTVDFVTDETFWVFWVNGGVLYARKFGTTTTIVLAESNCTDVSAIRAMWSEAGSFDFGLVVFFLLNGTIYYRQFINDEWMDAEVVTFGPPSTTWTSITAFRTWDYRIGVQGKTSDNKLYEMFTQFMGIGKQTTEHIALTKIQTSSDIIGVDYHDGKLDEHVALIGIQSDAPYGGLYSTAIPQLVKAFNMDDGEGDWGKKLTMVFDSEVNGIEAAMQTPTFNIVDAWGIVYSPAAIETVDGRNLVLTFIDFNNARGACTARYIPGTVHNMNGDIMMATSVVFTPLHLVPSEIPLPEVEAMWNE